MIVVNTPTVPGREIAKVFGIVIGNTVRARHLGRDIFAGLKNIIGGEISEYTKLLAQAREQARERMEEEANKLGADAIVNVRIATSSTMQMGSEIMMYGTAVKLG